MKAPLRVGIDVDGVLRDFVGSFAEQYKIAYGDENIIEPVTDYVMWKKHYPFPNKGLYDKFYNESFPYFIFGCAKLTYPTVMTQLQEVMKYFGNNIHWTIVTQQKQRNWRITFDWLMRHECPINEFRFCSNIEEKIVGVDILIDDYDENLWYAANHGVIPIRYEQPWNKGNYKAVEIIQTDYSIKNFSELGAKLEAWIIR